MTSLIRIELPVGQLGRLTGQTETLPQVSGQGSGSGGSLDTPQVAAEIGDPVPIVFARWREVEPIGQRGGVTIAPLATDGNFSNDGTGAVTARYQLLLSDGRLGDVEVRDVFQGGVRVGAFTQAYDRRAGSWGPGYSMVPWGIEPAPAAPDFVGTGQGLFDDVTMGSFSITTPVGDEAWRRQVFLFIREGMEVDRLIEEDRGPSDNLADLVVWALLRSGRVSAQLVDGAAMLIAAEFLDANALRFNAEIATSAGLLDWLTEVLPHYLLRLVRSRGVYRLRPLLPTTEAGQLFLDQIEWTRTFSVADIDVPSLQLSTIPSADRRPIALLVRWRQQLEDADAFVRTTTVRYGGSAMGGPYEQVDLSSHVTSAGHAVTYGAFRLARRRYVEHRLTFRLRPSADSELMAEGDIVRVVLEATSVDGGPVRIDQLYSVEQISRSPAGVASLELLHFPVDDQGRSLVALDVAAAQALPVGLPSVSGRGGTGGGDQNSRNDTTVPPDLGPWPQWDPPPPEEPLYPPGDDLGWPVDVSIPEIQFPELDPLLPISDLNPNPVLPTPVPPVGDGWGPGRIPALDIEELDLPDVPDEDTGYVAAVSFDQVRLRYPDVFYLINTPNAVDLDARVTVDNPPVGRSLTLVISDGATDEAWRVVIPVGQTTALLPSEASSRTDTPFDDSERSLEVISYSGGGYFPPAPTEEEPDPGPAVTTTPAAFTVRAYTATVSVDGSSPWVWDGGAWTFFDLGGAGNFTWNYATQEWDWSLTDAFWDWDSSAGRWVILSSPPSGWAWLEAGQRWQRTSSATDPGSRPALPPAGPVSTVPSSEPSGPGEYTVVVEVSVDKVPINGLLESLRVSMIDALPVVVEEEETLTDVQDVGAAIVNGVPMLFGAWRWNPAESTWERDSPLDSWAWSSTGATWIYLSDPGDWTWNQSTEVWEGGTGSPPGGPPLQNGSTHPPDGERWTLNEAGTLWIGTAHVEGGVAPFFGNLLKGWLTYHLPFPELLAPPGEPVSPPQPSVPPAPPPFVPE